MRAPVVLLVLDGWGHREQTEQNAIAQAPTPVLDKLSSHSQRLTLIDASGHAVGLPDGQMGNSEVGHLCIGSGRIVYQSLMRINQSIESGEFHKNSVYLDALKDAGQRGGAVHIMGLLSPGGVHSHQEHIYAMLRLASEHNLKSIYLHAFLDGRDTPPRSASASLQELEALCAQLSKGSDCHISIASICGRYYAMDRDSRWERTEKAWCLLRLGQAPHRADDAGEALAQAYERGENDEFVLPTIIGEPRPIEEQDVAIFMNFRADRARQISQALTDPGFQGFKRTASSVHDAHRFVMTTPYHGSLKAPCAFPSEHLKLTLGECLEHKQCTQLHLAETEKYAHVTFFFNGGREQPFVGEERILVPSPKVATYDLRPEMSAKELTTKLTQSIRSKQHAFIVCNYANGDMVGHTGVFEAALKAVETVDQCIGKVIEAIDEVGGDCLITADHGNCEQMHDSSNNQAHTAHTAHLVPFIYHGERDIKMRSGGGLSDVAPSVLKLMGLEQPSEMTGRPLFDLA
jgi:2,3-bisphosphoglycerate-independent phosphoglycerate mutase